jgi:mono/diheme cytochrome c family protein
VRSLFAALLGVLFGVGSLQAAEPPDYLREIRPILKERCFACHGGLKQEGSLRVDTAAAIRAGGDSGAAVEIGKAAESLLIARVSASDEEERMPAEGQPLTAEEIAKLTAWINSGAKAPVDEEPEPDPRKHWAFQLPQRTEVSRVGDPLWQQNPIDAFLAAEGTVVDRVMAAMEAADRAGGDSRCSCRTEPTPETDIRCGHKTAHVAYIAAAKADDPIGEAHSSGEYSLFIDVDDENTQADESSNPVATLRMRFDAWKATGGLDALGLGTGPP